MESMKELRVGVCGIGLEAYWAQFAGLENEARRSCRCSCGEDTAGRDFLS